MIVRRRVHDNDAFWVWAVENNESFREHCVSFEIELGANVFFDRFDLQTRALFTREHNRQFVGGNVNNLNLAVSTRIPLFGGSRPGGASRN